MRVEKREARASRQAKARAPKDTNSVSQRRRLTDEEWREVWSGPTAWVWVAGIAALFAAACGVI